MRSTLRLRDLQEQETKAPEQLMNTLIPEDTMSAIDDMADTLGASKTAVVIALLNEGLDIFAERRGEFPTPSVRRARRGRPRQ